MEVKEAVTLAKDYISEIYADEGISEIGLEEVEFHPEDKFWDVTIGFRRRFKKPVEKQSSPILDIYKTHQITNRWYKSVRINDVDKRVLSVMDRELGAA